MADTQVVQERESSGLKRAVTPAMLLLVGLALWAVNLALTRREAQ